MKITEINKKTLIKAELPDGVYIGKWCGYQIEVEHEKETYFLNTEQGVKGINIGVAVEVINGEATFELLRNYTS